MTARIVNKPNTRPDIVNARASQRLWGSALIPNGARRIVAVGWPTGKRPGTTYVLHAPIGHGMISRVQVL